MRLPPEVLRDGDDLLEEAAGAIVGSLDLQVLDLAGDERYLKLVKRQVLEHLVRAAAEVDVEPYEQWKHLRDRLEAGR